MISYLAILSLVIAVVRGGSFSRLGHLDIRQMWLVFVAPVCIILLLVGQKLGYSELAKSAGGMLHLLSYCALILLVWLNRRLAGASLLAIGLLMNMAVLVANGGLMPVSYDAAVRAGMSPTAMKKLAENDMNRHVLMSEKTRLNFLSDIIAVSSPPLPSAEVMSPGDAVLALGVFVLIQAAMLAPRRVDLTVNY